MRRITVFLAAAACGVIFAGEAKANEFTNVIDAFDSDNGDPFDLNLSVGYERFHKSGVIKRENFDGQPHNWDYYAYRDMAEYKQVSHLLNLELDIGLFKDISLRARLPIILSDTRELTRKGDGWSGSTELFSIPFKSPERSGIDHFAVGLWWGILAQERDDTKPDWIVYAEGRFGVGDEFKAACQTNGASQCSGDDKKGGISRGVNELAFGTRLSKRYGVMDPYFGIEALLGWSKGGPNYNIDGNGAGEINTMPPIVGTLDFGLEIVPWEVKENGQKFVIGLGVTGKYHSEGREITPLYDALGMSDYFLETPPDFNQDGQTDGMEEAAVPRWTGMTDVENYASFYGKLFFMIQPVKYVKFRLGTKLGHETEHFITKTDQCPSDQVNSANGTCVSYNLGHRPELDRPGNRFRVEETLIWTLFLDATAQF